MGQELRQDAAHRPAGGHREGLSDWWPLNLLPETFDSTFSSDARRAAESGGREEFMIYDIHLIDYSNLIAR